jgi:hypothetical protein
LFVAHLGGRREALAIFKTHFENIEERLGNQCVAAVMYSTLHVKSASKSSRAAPGPDLLTADMLAVLGRAEAAVPQASGGAVLGGALSPC